MLRAGFEIFPNSELLKKCQDDLNASIDYNTYTPFDLVDIYDADITNDKGIHLGYVKSRRPVFHHDYQHAEKFNKVIGDLSFKPDFMRITEPASTSTVKKLFKDWIKDAQEVINQGVTSDGFHCVFDWKVSYRKGPIVSINCETSGMGYGGTHGSFEAHGKTFNLQTGAMMKITDVLNISADKLATTLYKEFVDYQLNAEHGKDHLIYNSEFTDDIKKQCNENINFWLNQEGVHLDFGTLYSQVQNVGVNSLSL